jgi:hypothetical protein
VRRLLLPALVLLGLLPGPEARALTLVFPGSLASQEGGSNLYFPFSTSAGQSMRYQQVFDAAGFSGVSGPISLTAIAFRPEGFILGDGAVTGTIPNVEIRLSTTAAGAGTLSGTFADNVGPDEQVVFDGSLTLSSANVGNPGPKAFDLVIALEDPFVYDPASGHLLLDVRNFSGGFTTWMDAAFSSQMSRVYSALFGGSVSSPSGTVDSIGLVAQFTFEVPETSTLALCVLFLGARRRDRS